MFGKKFGAFVIVGLMLCLLVGCAAKPPVMREGHQVEMFVLVDRGIKDSMKDDERNDRSEMGQFMEEDLVKMLNHEGYKAAQISNQDQYPLGSTQYLLNVRINDLHTTSRAVRLWINSISWVDGHFELYGSGKTLFAYDDRRSTMGDWTVSPHELHEGVVTKINEQLNTNAK